MTALMYPPGFETSDGVDRAAWEALDLPPGYRAEMIRGELVVSPTPAQPHVVLQNRLSKSLDRAVPDGYETLHGSAWKIDGETVYVAREPQPDLIVAPRSLAPIVSAPLLAVEILSPSDRHRLEKHPKLTRIQGKRLDYAVAGLQHYLEIELAQDATGGWFLRYELTDGVLEVVDQAEDVFSAEVPFLYEIDLPALLG